MMPYLIIFLQCSAPVCSCIKKTDLNVLVSPAGDLRPQVAIEALEARNAEDENEANGEDLEDEGSEAVEVRAVADEAEEKIDDVEDSEVRVGWSRKWLFLLTRNS
jgi:hypothetical protein